MDMRPIIQEEFGEEFSFSECRGFSMKELTEYRPLFAPDAVRAETILEPWHGCSVLLMECATLPSTIRLTIDVPAFDSSDRENDAWHRLYLTLDQDGALHGIYRTHGYRGGMCYYLGHAQRYPDCFRPYFAGLA